MADPIPPDILTTYQEFFEYIRRMNPYTNPDGLPNPPYLMNVDIQNAESDHWDYNQEGETRRWEIKHPGNDHTQRYSHRVNSALRIPYKYTYVKPDGTIETDTEYLLIGFAGSAGA